MFYEFRQKIKTAAKSEHLTYAQIAEKATIKESTVKAFMCGATDSRRIAEKLADALGLKILYSNGSYDIIERTDD